MEFKVQVRRVCKNCGIEFELTKSQMRQAKGKWATNCSRSCAKKAQHARNHANKRIYKNCDHCEKEFYVTNWDKDKKYCSIKCSSAERFKDREYSIKSTKLRLENIIKDEKYLRYLKNISWGITHKWGRDEEFQKELLQEYFLALCLGHNTTIENVSKSFLRKELKKGITGKWDVDFSLSTIDALPYIKENYKKCSTSEFIKYISEVLLSLNELEREFLSRYLQGFKDTEVMKAVRKIVPISNENFYKQKKMVFEKVAS